MIAHESQCSRRPRREIQVGAVASTSPGTTHEHTRVSDVATWIREFAVAAGGTAPTDAERESILALASLAAHASERTAAPLTCWLAAAAGLRPDEALAVAQRVVERRGADERAQ